MLDMWECSGTDVDGDGIACVRLRNADDGKLRVRMERHVHGEAEKVMGIVSNATVLVTAADTNGESFGIAPENKCYIARETCIRRHRVPLRAHVCLAFFALAAYVCVLLVQVDISAKHCDT